MFSPTRNEDLSPESIRTRVVRRLQRELPEHALELRQDEPYRLRLCHPEAGELVLNIGNLVHEVRQSTPGIAEQIINAFVSMAKQALNPPQIELTAVYPALRHHAFLREADISLCDPLIGDAPGDLVSVVLADVGDGLATVTKKAAERAGLAPESILAAAERNFVGLLAGEVFTAENEGGILSVGLDGYPWLGTSLMFAPSILQGVMAHYGIDRALVAVPTRETVDLIDASRPNALAQMERWMLTRLAGPRPQSEFVLRLALGDELLTTTHRMSNHRLLGLN